MQKIIDRYDFRCSEMQKQIETLQTAQEDQRTVNERLNNDLADHIEFHQIQILSVKTDLKNLEERLVYKFNDYWNEVLDKLEKLDTRVGLSLSAVRFTLTFKCYVNMR